MGGRALGAAMSYADIDGGAIDGAIIGGTTAAAGTFTNLTSTGNTVLGNAAADTVAGFLEKCDSKWLVTGHIPLETGFEIRSERHVIVDCHQLPAGVVLAPMDKELGPLGIGGFCLRLG